MSRGAEFLAKALQEASITYLFSTFDNHLISLHDSLAVDQRTEAKDCRMRSSEPIEGANLRASAVGLKVWVPVIRHTQAWRASRAISRQATYWGRRCRFDGTGFGIGSDSFPSRMVPASLPVIFSMARILTLSALEMHPSVREKPDFPSERCFSGRAFEVTTHVRGTMETPRLQ